MRGKISAKRALYPNKALQNETRNISSSFVGVGGTLSLTYGKEHG